MLHAKHIGLRLISNREFGEFVVDGVEGGGVGFYEEGGGGEGGGGGGERGGGVEGEGFGDGAAG